MNTEDIEQSEQSKPVILFGRDIRTIPCFKNSILYGIYGGFAAGLITFLFTSRVRLATNVSLGSYMGVSTIYWCYCRYHYVKNKYTINEIHQLMKRSQYESIDKELEEPKLEDV